MDQAAQISLVIYAIAMALGGIAGFLKARSKASLIAGIVSALVLVGAYVLSQSDLKNGLLLGVGVTSVLSLVFAIRIAKTKKLIPAGPLLILTISEEMFLLFTAFIKI